CISSPIGAVVVDTVISQPIHTGSVYPNWGFITPVAIQCAEWNASDCGSTSYVSDIKIAHVLGPGPTGGNEAARVIIGTNSNVTQYYSGIDISDVGPDNSTYGGDVGAITVQTPVSLSYTTNVSYLSVHDTAYTGNHGLFGVSNTNATVSHSFFDNPIAANYSWAI